MEYDANGNLIVDRDRKIRKIAYNYLNLPDTIYFDNGNLIINNSVHSHPISPKYSLSDKNYKKKINSTLNGKNIYRMPTYWIYYVKDGKYYAFFINSGCGS